MQKSDQLRQMASEMRPWVKHNFGDRAAWQPLLGIVEELGEYAEAKEGGFRLEVAAAKLKDALADDMIFITDYCNCMGWDIGEVYDAAAPYTANTNIPLSLERALGKLAHAYLKTAQGIRKGEDHDRAGHQALIYIVGHLLIRAEGSFDLVETTLKTWGVVRLRDWKKDPVAAGETKPCDQCQHPDHDGECECGKETG